MTMVYINLWWRTLKDVLVDTVNIWNQFYSCCEHSYQSLTCMHIYFPRIHHRFHSWCHSILLGYCNLKYIQPTAAELHRCPPSHQASVGYQVYPEVELRESHWHRVCCCQMATSLAGAGAATAGALVLLHLHIDQAEILQCSQILL